MILEKMGPVCKNLEQGLMAIYAFWDKWTEYSFKAPEPKVMNIFQISWFYWIHVMIGEKVRSCLWKLEPGFQTYGLIRLLDLSCPKVVFRLQTLSVFQNFMIVLDSSYGFWEI